MVYLAIIGAVMLGCLLGCLKEGKRTAYIYGMCAASTFVVAACAFYAVGVIG